MGRRITGDQRRKLADDLRERYDAGATRRQLAAQTGLTEGLIRRLLAETGTVMRTTARPGRDPGPWLEDRQHIAGQDRIHYRLWVTQMHHHGRTVQDMAEAMGRSPRTATDLLIEAGIPTPQHRLRHRPPPRPREQH